MRKRELRRQLLEAHSELLKQEVTIANQKKQIRQLRFVGEAALDAVKAQMNYFEAVEAAEQELIQEMEIINLALDLSQDPKNAHLVEESLNSEQ